jgi:hypothetical protein
MNTTRRNKVNDPYLCITASGIQYQEDENLIEKLKTPLDVLGYKVLHNVNEFGVTRLNWLPLIKINLRNTHGKVVEAIINERR